MNKFGEARLTSVTSVRRRYCSRTDTSRLDRIAINTALPHGKTDVALSYSAFSTMQTASLSLSSCLWIE